MMPTLDSALALARKGFRVFPIPANTKKPVLIGWQNKATTDEVKIKEWFTDPFGDPEDHNIGICCNDLLVIDIEGKSKSGIEPLDTLRKIEAEVGRLHFLVETPSGGYHAYMRMPEGKRAASTVRKLWPGVDSRSWHSLVVADGSTVDGKAYKWSESIPDENRIPDSINDLPVAPDWLIEKSGLPKERDETPINVELDTPASLERAEKFLKSAKPAIQGDGGNDLTYKTAARLRDFAVSRDIACEMMLDFWNGRCEPPWDPDELDQLLGNVYSYAQNKPKVPLNGDEFTPVDIPPDPNAPKPDFPSPTPLEPFDPADLPDRSWIIPGMAARTFVTGLIAPSGAGKTQFLAQLMLAASASRHDVIGASSVNPTAIWCWNQEDDLIELKRRIGAARVAFGISNDDLAHPIYLNSGVEHPLILAARDQHGRIRETKNVRRIIDHMKAKGIGILIIDPLVEFHEADENNNVEMNVVGRAIRRIAKEANASVILGHHTRKPPTASSDGFAGNADSGRGAGALNATTRITLTLYTMTIKDAKEFGVPKERHTRYLRIDGARLNIGFAAAGAMPEWFERVGQPLRAGGEEVGVLKPAKLERSAESRVKKEKPAKVGQDGEEMGNPLAEALAKVMEEIPGAADGLNWARQVKGPFMAATGMSESYAKVWFSRLDAEVKVANGTVIKFPQKGQGGSTVAFVLDEDAPESIDGLLD